MNTGSPAGSPSPARPAKRRAPAPALAADLRAKYLHLIEERYGLRLSAQQAIGLDELVDQLLEQSGGSTADWLYTALTSGQHDTLLETLAARSTVSETHFFRVTPQIEALRRHVLPEQIRLRQDVPAARRLSIWSAGCSTGEEPYTLAILLREQLPSFASWHIDILGTDISPTALSLAAEACYREWSFRDTPPLIRQRSFVPEGKAWRLIEPLRRLVRFARHNLVADPFPTVAGGFDLILCRNVTIYFSPQTTQRLYHHFAEALAPGGWLLLGPSDSPPMAPTTLEPFYLDGAILWRRRAPESTSTPAAAAAARLASRRAGGPRPPASATAPPAAATAPPALPALPAVRPDPESTAPMGPAQLWALVHNGDRHAAREIAGRLAATAPLEAEVHLILGLLLLDEGEAEPALEVLRRTAFLAPNNALAQLGLGHVYHRLGARERARSALNQARRILALVPDADVVAGGGGVTAGELRQSIGVLSAERAG